MIWHNLLKTDTLVAIGLVIALIMTIALGQSENIQMTIAGGLIGYMGRGKLDEKKEKR